jgi:hypothetical protein
MTPAPSGEGPARWTCPDCGRQFGRRRQGHECAPAMTLEEYFSTGPAHERPVFDAVNAHLTRLGGVYVEPVSVGIFFKLHTTFVQLRPMTKWEALTFALPRRLSDPRIARKPVESGGRWFHTVNLRGPDDVDDVVTGWLSEAHAFEASTRAGRGQR